jgi:phosphatidylserine decarboxylase
MTARSLIARVFQQEHLNFVLTNRIPRRLATRFVGWFSKIEQPLVRRLSIATWRLFADLRLEEAKKLSFSSLHDCFMRELKDGVNVFTNLPDNFFTPIQIAPCGVNLTVDQINAQQV